MRIHKLRGLAALTTAALAVSMLASCGDDDEGDADGKVHITVEGWRPGDDQATIDTVKKRAEDFMDEHPDIVVEPIEWAWDAATFATQLAGDQLPASFRVPFTDTKGLAERKQILDVTEYVEDLPYADEFNPSVLEYLKGTDGKIYGLPSDVYGVGLHYNRTLFEEAGLDPDSPPTTWDEVREYADQIAEETDAAGYVQMSQNNTGGWMLTTLTYALGGRMQSDDGTEATVDNDATEQALQLLHDMRWEDDSMGRNTGYEWEPINQDFAAGKIGMYMSGSDVYNALVTTNQINPDDYGLAVLPLADSPEAGILGGGSVSAVSAKASPEEAEAATLWSDFYRVQKNYDEDAAVLDAETLAAADQPIGTPTLPIFDKARWDQVQQWIEPYINVPRDQMTSFTDGVFSQQLISEPRSKTQELYGLLDSAVQKVLTDEGADIPAILGDLQDQAQQLLDQS